MVELNKYKEDHADLYEFAEKINNSDDTELLNLFKFYEFDQNEKKINIIIQMISFFLKHRPHSFNMVSNFLLNISDTIKKLLSEDQIMNSFKNSSQALLDFLFKKKIISKIMNESDSTEAPVYTSFYIQNLEEKISEEEASKKTKDNSYSIRNIIQNDDIDSFQNYISQTNEDINSNFFKPQNQNASNFLNAYEKRCQKYIEYAALYGSIQIFKYLWMNNAFVTDILFPFSVYGGNFEIIHLVESKIINDKTYSKQINQIMSKAVTAAVFSFRHELVSYLCENYSITFEYSALNQSLISFNYVDLLYMIEYDPIVLNTFSDDLNETIFHNPNYFIQYDIIKYILSNFLKSEKKIKNLDEIQIGLCDKIVLKLFCFSCGVSIIVFLFIILLFIML